MTSPAILAPSPAFTPRRRALLVMTEFLGLRKCVGLQILFVVFVFCLVVSFRYLLYLIFL